MSAFTAKVHQLNKAPKRIELLGDKTVRPEPAQHVIEFPGGAVEVSRTEDGNYWAHILINRGWAMDDVDGLHNQKAVVLDSRLGTETNIFNLPHDKSVYQIAVLIGREENHV